MRYRSVTVAGFHGLPCFPKVKKERQASAPWVPAPAKPSLFHISESRCVDM
jgi:hypothetical protein